MGNRPAGQADREGVLHVLAAEPTLDPLIRTLFYSLLLVLAVGLVVGFFAFLKLYRIPSASMEPTLRCERPAAGCSSDASERVVAVRIEWPFDEAGRGDIVAFSTPARAEQRCGAGGTFVSRIVGLPGETWEQRDGVVYIDGKRLEESYIEDDRRDRQTYPPRRIPASSYFVEGDNRSQSCDSRVWGTLPGRNLVARVVATYWPPGRIALR